MLLFLAAAGCAVAQGLSIPNRMLPAEITGKDKLSATVIEAGTTLSVGGYPVTTSGSGDYVTTDTAQVITGLKTFNNNQVFNGTTTGVSMSVVSTAVGANTHALEATSTVAGDGVRGTGPNGYYGVRGIGGAGGSGGVRGEVPGGNNGIGVLGVASHSSGYGVRAQNPAGAALRADQYSEFYGNLLINYPSRIQAFAPNDLLLRGPMSIQESGGTTVVQVSTAGTPIVIDEDVDLNGQLYIDYPLASTLVFLRNQTSGQTCLRAEASFGGTGVLGVSGTGTAITGTTSGQFGVRGQSSNNTGGISQYAGVGGFGTTDAHGGYFYASGTAYGAWVQTRSNTNYYGLYVSSGFGTGGEITKAKIDGYGTCATMTVPEFQIERRYGSNGANITGPVFQYRENMQSVNPALVCTVFHVELDDGLPAGGGKTILGWNDNVGGLSSNNYLFRNERRASDFYLDLAGNLALPTGGSVTIGGSTYPNPSDVVTETGTHPMSGTLTFSTPQYFNGTIQSSNATDLVLAPLTGRKLRLSAVNGGADRRIWLEQGIDIYIDGPVSIRDSSLTTQIRVGSIPSMPNGFQTTAINIPSGALFKIQGFLPNPYLQIDNSTGAVSHPYSETFTQGLFAQKQITAAPTLDTVGIASTTAFPSAAIKGTNSNATGVGVEGVGTGGALAGKFTGEVEVTGDIKSGGETVLTSVSAAQGFVTTATAQTISGVKTFTTLQHFQGSYDVGNNTGNITIEHDTAGAANGTLYMTRNGANWMRLNDSGMQFYTPSGTIGCAMWFNSTASSGGHYFTGVGQGNLFSTQDNAVLANAYLTSYVAHRFRRGIEGNTNDLTIKPAVGTSLRLQDAAGVDQLVIASIPNCPNGLLSAGDTVLTSTTLASVGGGVTTNTAQNITGSKTFQVTQYAREIHGEAGQTLALRGASGQPVRIKFADNNTGILVPATQQNVQFPRGILGQANATAGNIGVTATANDASKAFIVLAGNPTGGQTDNLAEIQMSGKTLGANFNGNLFAIYKASTTMGAYSWGKALARIWDNDAVSANMTGALLDLQWQNNWTNNRAMLRWVIPSAQTGSAYFWDTGSDLGGDIGFSADCDGNIDTPGDVTAEGFYGNTGSPLEIQSASGQRLDMRDGSGHLIFRKFDDAGPVAFDEGIQGNANNTTGQSIGVRGYDNNLTNVVALQARQRATSGSSVGLDVEMTGVTLTGNYTGVQSRVYRTVNYNAYDATAPMFQVWDNSQTDGAASADVVEIKVTAASNSGKSMMHIESTSSAQTAADYILEAVDTSGTVIDIDWDGNLTSLGEADFDTYVSNGGPADLTEGFTATGNTQNPVGQISTTVAGNRALDVSCTTGNGIYATATTGQAIKAGVNNTGGICFMATPLDDGGKMYVAQPSSTNYEAMFSGSTTVGYGCNLQQGGTLPSNCGGRVGYFVRNGTLNGYQYTNPMVQVEENIQSSGTTSQPLVRMNVATAHNSGKEWINLQAPSGQASTDDILDAEVSGTGTVVNIDWGGNIDIAGSYKVGGTTLNSVVASYGELYATGSSTAITITTGGDWYQWVDSTVGIEAGSGYVVGSTSTDSMTVGSSGAGDYDVDVSIAFNGSANEEFEWGVFVDDVLNTKLTMKRKLGSTGDIGSMTLSGRVALTATDVLTLKVRSVNDAKTVTPEIVNFRITRVKAN